VPGERISSRNGRDCPECACYSLCLLVEKTDRSSLEKDQHQAEDKSPVADAVGDERFLRGRRSFVFIEIKTDQQVRAEPDTFPPDKHQKKIVREYQCQHREHEQIQVCEEAVVTAISAHVAGGKDVNQKTYKGDEEHVDAAQAIHGQGKVRAKLADLNPRPKVIHDRLRRSQCAIGIESEIKRNQT
jgi:hypothetical protein